MKQVVIIGAGLAGLCCARRLLACGVPFQILEASDGVGGRVRTDVVDGFRLDRGFQLFLPAYPEAARVLDYAALNLQRFTPGALVRFGGKFHRVADPRHAFLTAAKSAFNPIGSLRDKLRLAQLKWKLDRVPFDALGTQPDTTTRDFLMHEAGFSDEFITRLAVPFLGGVFLEANLDTSSRFFRFVFQMFAQAAGAVPALGMQEIPEQIARSLPAGSLRLNARVEAIDGNHVRLTSGEVLEASAVVVATESHHAARLTGGLVNAPPWNGNVTLYFAADKSPIGEPILAINGEGRGVVNSVAVMSDVSSQYAPPGASLISVSMVGVPPGDLRALAMTELESWYGPSVKSWKFLREYRIPEALPAQGVHALQPWQRPVKLRDGLYIAGDHRDNASIDGAMTSGFRAAQAVMAEVRARSVSE
jgi:protoporphyrinogen oxidase